MNECMNVQTDHSTHEKNIKGIINDVCFNEKRNNKLFFFLLVTLISVN